MPGLGDHAAADPEQPREHAGGHPQQDGEEVAERSNVHRGEGLADRRSGHPTVAPA